MTKTQAAPIELYYWATPNGKKVTLFLEEAAVPYVVHYVNIGAGDQFKPEFLAISPNNKMPAIVDPEGPDRKPISVFESGAILLYLARKVERFLPKDERARVEVEEWLMWQMGGFGPMLGQNHHFSRYAPEKIPYAIKRFQNETHRLYGVLDKRLAGRDFIARELSIADMAVYPWSLGYEAQEIDLAEFPNVKRWQDTLAARPAVVKGLAVGEDRPKTDLTVDKDAQAVLFNQRAR